MMNYTNTLLEKEQRELLAYLLAEEGIELETTQRISPRENPDERPLSFAQQGLWFLEQLMPGTPTYNIAAAIRIFGQLNVKALEQSLNEIVQRHEVLRASFITVDEQPIQVIHSALTLLTLSLIGLRGFPEAERHNQVLQLAVEEAQQPFDLAGGLLLRTKLLPLAEEEYVLLVTMHHIISDGWSLGVLVRELAALYEAFSNNKSSPLSKLPIQYADFAVWQRQWLQKEVLETQLTYWKQTLAGSLPILELPTDRPRKAVQTFQGTRYLLQLPKSLSEALAKLSQQEGVTLFMTLLTAFKILLYRYTGQEDILVGSPIANRNQAETEYLIGFFVNTLVLRTDLGGNPSFRDLLNRVREVVLGAYNHQDLPFEKLVEILRPERNLSHTPLFQVMFALQNTPMPSLEFSGLILSPLEIDSKTAKFDFTLDLSETPNGISGWLEYNTDLFDADTISRMAGHFQTLLEGIVAHPNQQLSNLSILTRAEQHQLLVEFNQNQSKSKIPRCLHQLFEAQVEQTPDAIAVSCAEEQFSYSELNRRANQLANYLRSLGVRSEVSVGICLERSLDLVVGLLGILKTGGAYIPLDPNYPQERLAFMLQDSQVPVLLTQSRQIARLPEHQAKVICLDIDWETINQQSGENPNSQVLPTDKAYTLYTSGSTGQPKGVIIEHRSTVALIDWATNVYTTEELASVLASTSICFDLSVFELFVPLSCGGKVVLVDNILALPSLSALESITLINTVPSAIAELLRVNGVAASVCTINLAGEPLAKKLIQQLYQQTSVQKVFNLYGPSEDTTYSTFTLVKPEDSVVSIGRPIVNTQLYILDSDFKPVPIGVKGELYIAGEGLARGYLNRPDLTAQKFISNPFSQEPCSRLYQTGDLGRYLSDGNIEYLGRRDRQVKIRGFRIELGEIEAVLSQHPEVHTSVVMAQKNEDFGKQLVAYVVPQPGLVPPVNELRKYLKQHLPEYMVPSAFAMLDALPLTPNGKIDRQTLATINLIRSVQQTEFVGPRNSVEQMLERIWAEVLDLEQVGVYDNFFELGGHSLLVTQIVSRVRDAFGVDLPLRSLFEAATVADVAELIVDIQVEQADSQTLAEMLGELEQLSPDEVQRILASE